MEHCGPVPKCFKGYILLSTGKLFWCPYRNSHSRKQMLSGFDLQAIYLFGFGDRIQISVSPNQNNQ